MIFWVYNKYMDKQAIESAISQGHAAGKSKEALYAELLTAGASVADIQAGFAVTLDAAQAKADTQKNTVNIILFFAAFLVAAGIFAFIAANWAYMPSILKVTIILVVTLAFHLAGWFTEEQKQMPRLGRALVFLGTMSFGAGIFLVGQIFNISSNWPDGFLLWFFGALATGLALNSYAHYGLALVLSFIVIVANPLTLFDSPDIFTAGLAASSFLLIAASVVAAWLAARMRKADPPPGDIY